MPDATPPSNAIVDTLPLLHAGREAVLRSGCMLEIAIVPSPGFAD